MGGLRPPTPVALLCALTFGEPSLRGAALAALAERFGPVALEQEPFLFDQTSYYEEEMGAPLFKGLVLFKDLVDAESLPEAKLAANDIEAGLAAGGRRRVNLDPGYLAPARLVLASTKDFAHRLYLGKRVYGEVTLRFQGGEFEPLPWTYPDYRDPRTLRFLKEARVWYLNGLEGHGARED